jgi:sugar/nucleoside kinase (ribokinase family)
LPKLNASSRFTVVGNANADLVAWPVSELPEPGGDLVIDRLGLRVGGAAANAALALAALGTPPLLVAAVGDDLLGRFVHAELERVGVAEGVQVLPSEPTGISIGLEGPERDRTFITYQGCLATFDGSLVPDHAFERPYFLISGYFALPSLRGAPARRLLERAAAGGATRLLDPDIDSDGWSAAAREELAALLPLVDVFLPNEHEAAGLAGRTDPEAAAAHLQARSGGWVIVKCGRDGCIGVGPGGARLAVPAVPATAPDTTGAGDAFDAALMHALASGATMEEAAAFAVRYASAVIQRPSDDRHPGLDELPVLDHQRG